MCCPQIRWTDAESKCVAMGGHLVSILNRDEAEYVHYMLTSVWWSYPSLIYIGEETYTV